MDIEYLLWLQNLREGSEVAEILMALITKIPKSPLSALIPGILFWCVSRRAGLFLLFLASFGRLVNTLIKDTLCVYRPWILDSAVHPTAATLKDASSYSMPSGHTQGAMAIYGGLAYFYREKFPRLIIPCVLIILLVGFSRNFLGAHTPQDVLVAILESAIVIFLADKMFDEMERDKNSAKIFFGAGVIFLALAAIYILAKSYPVDYQGGKIIVSAAAAKIDSLDALGGSLGFLIGAALENKFVNFSTNVDFGVKVRRVLIGAIVGGAAMALLLLLKWSGVEIAYEFCKGFLPIISIVFLAPFAFNYFETKTKFRFKKIS